MPKQTPALTLKQPIFKRLRPHFKSYLIIAIALFALAVIYYFRGLFIAAVVNGEPISRLSLVQKLERQSGKQTLDSFISEALILQEARKQNLIIKDAQIEEEITRLKTSLSSQGENLDLALEREGIAQEELRKQIKIQMIIESLIAKDIKVTEDEVNDFIKQNQNFIPQGAPSEEIKAQAEQQLKQQKTAQKFQAWLGELQKKAKINYFVNF